MVPDDDCRALRFDCPRCGHVEDDDYEVIDCGVPTDWRCAACRRVFSVLLTECDNCSREGVHTALTSTEQSNATDLLCRQCGRPVLRHDELAESGEPL